MAGNGSRAGSGRSAGGSTKASAGAGSPPAPSAMRVNLFQEASRAARARATQGSLRAAGNTARRGNEAGQAARGKGSERVFRRAVRGQVSSMRGSDYYAGNQGLFRNMNGPGGAQAGKVFGQKNQVRQRGYRAPRTRLLPL